MSVDKWSKLISEKENELTGENSIINWREEPKHTKNTQEICQTKQTQPTVIVYWIHNVKYTLPGHCQWRNLMSPWWIVGGEKQKLKYENDRKSIRWDPPKICFSFFDY